MLHFCRGCKNLKGGVEGACKLSSLQGQHSDFAALLQAVEFEICSQLNITQYGFNTGFLQGFADLRGLQICRVSSVQANL